MAAVGRRVGAGDGKRLLIDGAEDDTSHRLSPRAISNVITYSNLAASVEHTDSKTGSPVRILQADESLDVAYGPSPAPSGWSVAGASSERSWTPSAVTERIRNWPQWANIKTFVAAICFLITVHGTLSTGYIMSVITTIEKRFEIRSRTSGMVVSSYEFGSLLSVLFVSYFGSRGHIPRWIGLGAILLSCGSFLWSFPHFLASPPKINDTGNFSHVDLCRSSEALASGNANCLPDGSSASKYVFVLILAQILIGVGGSPIFTLGTTYIDNHVSKESSSVYLAFMYVFLAFGPVCGFLLGALMLSSYVDGSAPPGVTHDGPSWIGLWWGGFIICGALYFLSSLPFVGFPGKLSTANTVHAENDYGKSLKKIPFSVFRLVTNSVYMVASLNACMDLAIVSGFTVFLPKYLETQFGMTGAKASILTGSVAIPGACVGIFLGGWVLKRFKLQLKGVASLVVGVNFVCLAGLSLFFFLGCENLNMPGIFKPYKPTIYDLPNPLQKAEVNLTVPCNSKCHCSAHDYMPICGQDKQTYFSPCFAGCHKPIFSKIEEHRLTGKVFLNKITRYSDCDCIGMDNTTARATATSRKLTGGVAEVGACESNCTMLVPFLVVLFLLTLIASNNQMPLVMVTLRAVAEEEKAFALGVQVVILRLLAYIPAPILFGQVIDTTCLVWKPNSCGDDGSTCLLYDIRSFRVRYGSIALVLKVAAAALSLVLWWCIKRRCRGAEPFSAPITMSEIAHRLGDVENLHIRPVCPSGNLRSWMSDDSIYSRPRSPARRCHQKTMSC